MIGVTRRRKPQVKVRTDWLLTALLTLCATLLGLMNGLDRFDQVFHGYALASVPMGALVHMLQPWQAAIASCLPVLLASRSAPRSSPGAALLTALALSTVLGGLVPDPALRARLDRALRRAADADIELPALVLAQPGRGAAPHGPRAQPAAHGVPAGAQRVVHAHARPARARGGGGCASCTWR